MIAVRVASDLEKQMLLAADDVKFFTEPHYNGFPAVLVRLPAVDVEELDALITMRGGAWRQNALVKEFDQRAG